MSAQAQFTFSASTLSLFDAEISKYPAEQKASAVMACLAIIQHESGHVSQAAESALANYLGMPEIAVHEVLTFYNMYNAKPVGRYKLNVCTNLPCQLRGGQKALEQACQHFGIAPGETSPNGQVTVQASECLGACADAPVLLVNDRTMCSHMNEARLNELLGMLTSSAAQGAGHA